MIVRLAGYNAYSVQFSPFSGGRKIACASSTNYGIIGNGRLHIIHRNSHGKVVNIQHYDTQDALFDCCWSELNDRQLITCSGDGSIKLWDESVHTLPIRIFKEHEREVFCVNWNVISRNAFISCSWDGQVKMWVPDRKISLQTWNDTLSGCVYSSIWSPRRSPNVFATASADGNIRLFDTQSNHRHPIQTIHAHANEVLSLDWSKYHDSILFTASSDSTVKMWDIRNPSLPLSVLGGHEMAVRRVKSSPFHANIIASVGYDMTMRLWDLTQPEQPKQLQLYDAHSEFVFGFDWNYFDMHEVATCSWDESVHILKI